MKAEARHSWTAPHRSGPIVQKLNARPELIFLRKGIDRLDRSQNDFIIKSPLPIIAVASLAIFNLSHQGYPFRQRAAPASAEDPDVAPLDRQNNPSLQQFALPGRIPDDLSNNLQRFRSVRYSEESFREASFISSPSSPHIRRGSPKVPSTRHRSIAALNRSDGIRWLPRRCHGAVRSSGDYHSPPLGRSQTEEPYIPSPP